MTIRRLWALFFLLIFPAAPAWAAGHRVVEVRYDLTVLGQGALQIWINCVHTEGPDGWRNCKDNTPKLSGPDAFGFTFSDKDEVRFIALYQRAADGSVRAEITYSLAGSGVSDKDVDALRKIVGGGAPETKAGGREPLLAGAPSTADFAEVLAMTDQPAIGQKILVTFALKQSKKEGNTTTETTTLSRGPLAFRVSGPPRFKVSYGLAFSNAPNPSVAIQKTSTLVNVEKDGKTQQVYQQVIALRDADAVFQPVQSLVTFFNVRLAGSVYGSIGFQVNKKVFEEPMLGLTYRHEAGSVGLNVTAGVHFSREVRIRADTGFYPGFLVDPTQALTTDEIATETRTHHRVMLALTVDFR